MLTNVSRGNAHGSASFPFVEGNPFTATLWVGPEGFHMAVNGRHETSFAYREVSCQNTYVIFTKSEKLVNTLKLCILIGVITPALDSISTNAET